MSSSLGLCRGTMLVVATLAFLISASPSVHGGTVERQPLSQAFGGSDTQAFGNFRPKVSMKTPFKRRGHMRWADGFSSPQGAGDSPWGLSTAASILHQEGQAPFIAVFPGRVLFVHTAEQPFGWAVNVLLEFDEVFMAEYGFEPQSPGDAPLQTQLGLMRVAEGDQVKRDRFSDICIARMKTPMSISASLRTSPTSARSRSSREGRQEDHEDSTEDLGQGCANVLLKTSLLLAKRDARL